MCQGPVLQGTDIRSCYGEDTHPENNLRTRWYEKGLKYNLTNYHYSHGYRERLSYKLNEI